MLCISLDALRHDHPSLQHDRQHAPSNFTAQAKTSAMSRSQHTQTCTRKQALARFFGSVPDLLCLDAGGCPTLTNMLVIIVGGIPIAMPTVLSVTLALGAYKLAKEGAIVARMSAVEEMAGMDILCSDKTGAHLLLTAAGHAQPLCLAALCTHRSASCPFHVAFLSHPCCLPVQHAPGRPLSLAERDERVQKQSCSR